MHSDRSQDARAAQRYPGLYEIIPGVQGPGPLYCLPAIDDTVQYMRLYQAGAGDSPKPNETAAGRHL